MGEIVTIERMGFGPEAVAHLESGKAVFVEGGAPGDVLAIELTEEKHSFARARIVEVKEPAACRVAPTWAEPSSQGVVPWQHLAYETQLAAKTDNVVAALSRTAGFGDERAAALVRPCLGSKRQWGYRNKIELGAAFDAAGMFQLGFHDEGCQDVVASATCPVAYKQIERAPKALRGALRFAQGADDLGIFRVGVRHSVRTHSTEVALWTTPAAFPRGHVANILKGSFKATSIVRVLADPGRARKIKGVEVLDGKGFWEEKLLGFTFRVAAPSFFQVNTAQAEKLIGEVIRGLGGEVGDEGPVGLDEMLIADLYSGGGTFSIPLAAAGRCDCCRVGGKFRARLAPQRRCQRGRHRDYRWRCGPRASRAGRARRARRRSASCGPGRRRGGEHRRGAPRACGVRELQSRDLGA